MLNISEIPPEIKKELSSHFTNVLYSNYSNPITNECQTFKAEYRKLIVENVSATILNPITFCPEIINDATISEGYIIRGIVTENNIDVYAIISSGPMSHPK